jgi:hypothetical protein
VQGTYAGFRLIDISSPGNPKEIINWEDCASRFNSQGNQGDVIIWEDLIIRSWNSGTPSTGSHCGNWQRNPGEEGVHVIDISGPLNPEVVALIDLLCGSHTETLVPDLDNDWLLVYSNSSAGTFPFRVNSASTRVNRSLIDRTFNIKVLVRGGSPGNRTLNLRIKSPLPACFHRLSSCFEVLHRRRSET